MIGMLVEKIARLLVRQEDAAAGGQRDAPGILARHTQGTVERQNRARGIGRRAGKLQDFLSWNGIDAEQRIGEHFAQACGELTLGAAGKLAEIDPERLGELDEQRGGDATLIVLDKVEIARRDAEPA